MAVARRLRGSDDVGVVVADPAPLFRAGVVAALNGAAGLRVVGEAADSAQLRDAVGRARPQVAVVDAWLDGQGIDTCRALAAEFPRVRLLVVASPAVDVDLATVAAAGATGFLARTATATELVDSVRSCAQGRALLSPDVATRMLGELAGLVRRRDSGPPRSTALSARELEVLRLVAQGLSNRAIGERLFISENTVKNHVRSVHEKLQVHSRMEAVVRAVREGLLEIA